MLRHRERDTDVARAVEVAGLAVVEQAEVLDPEPTSSGRAHEPAVTIRTRSPSRSLQLFERE